jgi:hypothetical protein
MSATEAVTFSNIGATTAAFGLKGGLYAMSAIATWGGGTVKIQMIVPDGSTGTAVDIQQSFDDGSATIKDLITGSFAANGMKIVFLPPGNYKVVIATASAVYVTITKFAEN